MFAATETRSWRVSCSAIQHLLPGRDCSGPVLTGPVEAIRVSYAERDRVYPRGYTACVHDARNVIADSLPARDREEWQAAGFRLANLLVIGALPSGRHAYTPFLDLKSSSQRKETPREIRVRTIIRLDRNRRNRSSLAPTNRSCWHRFHNCCTTITVPARSRQSPSRAPPPRRPAASARTRLITPSTETRPCKGISHCRQQRTTELGGQAKPIALDGRLKLQ